MPQLWRPSLWWPSILAHQFRQLGNVRRHAPCLVARQQSHVRAPGWRFVIVEITEDLTFSIFDVEGFATFMDRRATGNGGAKVTRYSAMRSILAIGMLNLPEMYSLSSSFERNCFP
jgi:hypothetical protein